MKRENTKINRKGSFRLLILPLLMACLISACAEKETDRTEITVIHGWGSTEPDHVSMRNIYMDFEAENPDIKLNLISMPSSDDVISKAQDMLSVGEIPDVMFTGGIGEESIYRFMVENDYALDLTPYISSDDSFRSSISDTTLARWTNADGSIYTVSDVMLLCGYWYNEGIFRAAGVTAPPGTWDELIEDCRRIQEWAAEAEEDIVPMVVNGEEVLYLTGAMLEGIDHTLLPLLGGTDPSAFENDAFREVIRMLGNLAMFTDVQEQYTYRDTLETFNSGRSAIYINGVWASTMIREEIRAAYAAFPSPDGSTVSCASTCLGYIVGNSSNQAKKDASVRFIKYMLSRDTQERIVRETGQIASNPQIHIEEISDNNRLLQAVSVVQSADRIIDVPVNLWSTDQKEAWLSYFYENLQNIEQE